MCINLPYIDIKYNYMNINECNIFINYTCQTNFIIMVIGYLHSKCIEVLNKWQFVQFAHKS